MLFHHSDVKPLTGSLALLDWRCNAAISVLWKRKESLLRFGQLTVIATQGKVPAGTVILTGLGASEEFSPDLRREAYRLALDTAVKLKVSQVALEGVPYRDEYDERILDDLQEALGTLGKNSRLRVTLFSGNREALSAPMAADDPSKSGNG